MDALFFAGLVAVGVVETILSSTWQPRYFRIGIPVFGHTRTVGGSAPPPSVEALERNVIEGPYSPMVFRDLGAGTYAFREMMYGVSPGRAYTPVMRGLVRFETTRRQVLVTGYLNWSTPMAFATVTAFAVSWIPGNPAAALAIVFLAWFFRHIYIIQRSRFVEVAETAARLWTS